MIGRSYVTSFTRVSGLIKKSARSVSTDAGVEKNVKGCNLVIPHQDYVFTGISGGLTLGT
jgi:hypothetical protein